MKSAITVIALILALAAMQGPAMAQGTKSIGASFDVALPQGDFGDVANTGFGGVVSFQYGWKPNFQLLIDFGYTSWSAKDNPLNLDVKWNAIPVQFGGKYYFTSAINRFYVGGLFGFQRFSIDVPFYNPFTGTTETVSASETEFGIGPMVGYELGISPNMQLDFGANYQMITDNLDYFGIRAGIIYNLK